MLVNGKAVDSGAQLEIYFYSLMRGQCLGGRDLQHLGATEWTGTDVMLPLCGELKSGEGNLTSFLTFFTLLHVSPSSALCLSLLIALVSSFRILLSGTKRMVRSHLASCFTS